MQVHGDQYALFGLWVEVPCGLSNQDAQREEVRQHGEVCRCAVYDADRGADRTSNRHVPRLLRYDRNRGASESFRKAGGMVVQFRSAISMGLTSTVRSRPRQATT